MPLPSGAGGAMLVGSSPAHGLAESLPMDSVTAVQVVTDGMGGFDTDSLSNPTAEISRLRENLARAEERRRMEAVIFEERARQVQAELEHCRAEGVLFSRLCEERDSMIGTLRSELREAQGERDAYKAELAEARFEFERERRHSASAGGHGSHSHHGRTLRQSSGPPPSSLPERGILETSGPTRLGSGPDRLAGDGRGGNWHTPVATSTSVALAAAVAQAAQADNGVPETSSRSVASARGANASNMVGPTGPLRQRSGDTGIPSLGQHSGGFQPKHFGPRTSSLPPPGHGIANESGTRSGSHAARVGGIPEAGRDGQEESSGQQSTSGYGTTGSAVMRTPSKSASKGRRSKSPEKPVEICISVPRALTPEELREMAELQIIEQEQPQMAAVPPARSLHRLPQTSKSAATSQTSQSQAMDRMVSRQASAPYAPAQAPASPSATDQWPSDPRWTGPGAAPPPPVRIVAAQQAPGAPGVGPKGSGSATVPTASGLSMAEPPPPRALIATAATSSPPSSSTVRPTISQARLGVAVRR